jgi:hypothetical protein
MFNGNFERDGIAVMHMTYILEVSGSNLALATLAELFRLCSVSREIPRQYIQGSHYNRLSNPHLPTIFDHHTVSNSLTGSMVQSTFLEADSTLS